MHITIPGFNQTLYCISFGAASHLRALLWRSLNFPVRSTAIWSDLIRFNLATVRNFSPSLIIFLHIHIKQLTPAQQYHGVILNIKHEPGRWFVRRRIFVQHRHSVTEESVRELCSQRSCYVSIAAVVLIHLPLTPHGNGAGDRILMFRLEITLRRTSECETRLWKARRSRYLIIFRPEESINTRTFSNLYIDSMFIQSYRSPHSWTKYPSLGVNVRACSGASSITLPSPSDEVHWCFTRSLVMKMLLCNCSISEQLSPWQLTPICGGASQYVVEDPGKKASKGTLNDEYLVKMISPPKFKSCFPLTHTSVWS